MLNLHRGPLGLEAAHPLGPSVGDGLRALDGEDEILRQAFLDDCPGVLHFHRCHGPGRVHRRLGLRDNTPQREVAFAARPTGRFRTPHPLPGQHRDLLDQVDRSHHQADLGVFVIFAGVVPDGHVALDRHGFFVLGRDAGVIRRPRDARGEVGDLDRRLAVELTGDVPVEHLRLVVREGGVEHAEFVDVLALERDLHRCRVDQRVGPRELQRVAALPEGDRARLADQRQVLGVVDRQLHGVPLGYRGQVDVLGKHGATKYRDSQDGEKIFHGCARGKGSRYRAAFARITTGFGRRDGACARSSRPCRHREPAARRASGSGSDPCLVRPGP